MIFPTLLLFYHLSNLCSASLPVPCILPAILLPASCHSLIFLLLLLFYLLHSSPFLHTSLRFDPCTLSPSTSASLTLILSRLPLAYQFGITKLSLPSETEVPNSNNKILIIKNCRILVFNNLFSHTIDFIKKL